MKGRTHLTVGLGIGAVASISHTIDTIPVILVASGVASLAPDLDGNNLLNKGVTKTAKQIKKGGVFLAGILMVLSLLTLLLDINSLYYLDESWFNQQNKLLLLGWGAVILGFSLRSQETLKNILMSIIGLLLLYYATTNELGWLVMFALYIGVVGWFAHRGPTHTIWALIYWWYMSYLLEVNIEVDGLALISTIAYLSHIVGDMLTKRGVKFLYPLINKVFRFRI
ncbi:metal-dependent hydrolase [Oceanobacillus sp. Castelsardo]|uniref:metal-dependent hydrolase n=1 Tax=Oceanobacillus sp. Castelsardo TaxID=1851204 RepID=UPI0008398E89|nr:metal-dependent hydrolase [Oceanobacillus sp. Castelsardo]